MAQKYTKFAVAGGIGGNSPISASLGNSIVRELLQKGVSVVVLGRATSVDSPAAAELRKIGAKIVTVDYSQESTLVDALHDVEVVISTLSGAGFASQPALVKAAKSAGTKLFVPSEFGNDTLTAEESSPLYGKYALHAQLEDLQLPYTLIFNGGFAEWSAVFLRVDKDGDINIVGDGEQPVSFTRFADVARFVAKVFTDSEPSQLHNATIPIEGSRYTLNELSKYYVTKHPEAKVNYMTVDRALDLWKTEHDFVAWLAAEWAEGRGTSSEKRSGLKNGLYPGWNPADIKDLV